MLDTNVLVHAKQGRPKNVGERLASLPVGEAVMSVVTYGELRNGAEKSRNREQSLSTLGTMVKIVPVQDVTAVVGVEYGPIRSWLEVRGEIIGANDLWIAAHARAARLTLVTGNEREFRRVPGLAVENWAS